MRLKRLDEMFRNAPDRLVCDVGTQASAPVMTSVQTIPARAGPVIKVVASPVSDRRRATKKTFGGSPARPVSGKENMASVIKTQVTELLRKSRRELEEQVIELVNGALSKNSP